MFHVCGRSGEKYSFLCPNGTLFKQNYLTCDFWYNSDCSEAESFYSVNERIKTERDQQGLASYGGQQQPQEPQTLAVYGGNQVIAVQCSAVQSVVVIVNKYVSSRTFRPTVRSVDRGTGGQGRLCSCRKQSPSPPQPLLTSLQTIRTIRTIRTIMMLS